MKRTLLINSKGKVCKRRRGVRKSLPYRGIARKYGAVKLITDYAKIIGVPKLIIGK